MDYSRLRAAALQGAEDEEAVTVDTRALIDKVLARYSGEWTTLRELIQNAADAQATTVTIKFETLPSTQVPVPSNSSRSELLKHVLTNHTLRRLVVSNNGQPFTKTDWARLKRIAEGNPDETKIGAFGVGFYSVFADCEEPFVSSGNEAMAFYWKGNALFTKKSKLPVDQASPNTAFVLDYRTATTPVPNILSVAQFLGTSLTFVALQKMEFWVDDWRLLALHKKPSPSVAVQIPRDLETKTLERIMNIAAVERTSTQIDASFMAALGWKRQAAVSAERSSEPLTEAPLIKSFFAKFAAVASQSSQKVKAQAEEAATQATISEDITAVSSSTVFLRVTTAQIRTSVSASFASELERATKKPPPKMAKLAILTSSYDGTAAMEAMDMNAAVKAADVFATVMPSKKPGGRVFIGFPTMQTTGAGLHISAPSVIPTVEREAIDLNARFVRSWNVEMLRAAGILTRLSFFDDMVQLNNRLRASVSTNGQLTKKEVAQHMPEALHVLKTYTFGDSTPSSQVGEHIENSFWTSFRSATVDVYSTRGVLPTSKVRLPSPEVAKFINGLPMVPEELKDTAFITKLIEFGLVTKVTMDDIRQELGSKAMDKEQLAAFIKWAGRSAVAGQLDRATAQSLLGAAIGMVGEKADQGEIVALSTVTHFVSGSKIPPNLPVPPYTIPFSLTNHCTLHELQALGWSPLEIYPWLQFLLSASSQLPDEENMLKSPRFSIQALTIVSKNWDTMTQVARDGIIKLLQGQTVIPTKLGMRKPADSFFPSVKIFHDLPVTEGCYHLKDKFLVAIGVRKTLDLETIFARLLSPSAAEGKKPWSHVELIRYLASVRDDIPPEDLKKFTEARMCPAETGPQHNESSQGASKLYKVSELFEPQDSLRALGLPILQWPGAVGSIGARSAEMRFLSSLGLRQYPSPMELVDMMAGPDIDLRRQAMAYFLSKHTTNGYDQYNLSHTTKAFLPLEGREKTLAAPSGCFTDEAAAVLGYKILRRDLHPNADRLGVSASPPIASCVTRLLHSPPKDVQQAKSLFSYFARRIHHMKDDVIAQLKNAPIVPVADSKGKTLKYTSPSACYLGSSSSYADIFDFVDFDKDSNMFLYRCGAKTEPSKFELAERACEEPARLLGSLQADKYLNLLRSLADNAPELKRDKSLWARMKRAGFLLATRTVSSAPASADNYDEEEGALKHYQLASPGQITIADDFIAYRIFQKRLLCAPEEELLERFYESLGANTLTSLVQEDLKIGSEVRKEDQAMKLRKHVLERSKIFLHEYTRDKKDLVRHDVKWLDKNMKITMVQSISLRRKLPGFPETDIETRSAASITDRTGCILYISAGGRPDMYQLSQALCGIMLKKHSQQAYIFFEPFLTLDLIGLRNRGYNVERILRAKAEQARIAEEERQRALQEEQRRIEENHKKWAGEEERQRELAQARSQRAEKPEKPREPSMPMPGAFHDDEELAPSPSQPKKSRGLLSSWTRRFGLDSRSSDESGDESTSSPSPAPAPAPAPAPRPQPQPPQLETGKVTNPAVLQQNLLNAVRSTKAYGSNELVSKAKMTEVQEQATYCDSTTEKDIKFLMESSRGMKIFVDKSLVGDEIVQFLSKNSAAVNAFASVLMEAGGIYKLEPKALHIFYDRTGKTIAFNRGGSIFSNLRYFMELHAPKLVAAPDADTAVNAKIDALFWWWVILAHELAHNLVEPHNAEHSFYTESFLQQYHAPLILKIADYLPNKGNNLDGNLARLPGQVPVPVPNQSVAAAFSAAAVPSGAPSLPPPPYSERPGPSARNPMRSREWAD